MSFEALGALSLLALGYFAWTTYSYTRRQREIVEKALLESSLRLELLRRGGR